MNAKNFQSTSVIKAYTNSKSKKIPAFIWIVLGIIFMAGLGYATTINERIVSAPMVSLENATLYSNTQIPTIYLFSDLTDSAGVFNRSRISFYAGANQNARRMLSLEAHAGNVTSGHENHISFYSDIKNTTDDRAMQWYWGAPDPANPNISADGSLRLVDLSYLQFENDWMGYYNNETAQSPGLKFDGNAGQILLDADNTSTASSSITLESFGSSVSETVTLFLQGTRGFWRYNGGSGQVQFGAGLTKTLALYADNKPWVEVALNGSVTMLNNTAGVLRVTNLTGTGNDFVCVNSIGVLYRSDSACA